MNGITEELVLGLLQLKPQKDGYCFIMLFKKEENLQQERVFLRKLLHMKQQQWFTIKI